MYVPSLATHAAAENKAAESGNVLARVCCSTNSRPARARHVVVRFDDARAFVSEYAENLSSGSLFAACDPGDVKRLDTVTVHLQISDLGGFRLGAQVVLVVSEAQAAAENRPAGLGLSIKCAPAGFSARLSAHLRLLGRRRDAVVLVSDEAIGRRLQTAGFTVERAPTPEDLLSAVVMSGGPVLAVVVPFWAIREYAKSATCIGAGDLLVGVAPSGGLRNLVRCLDERLGEGREEEEVKGSRARARPRETGERSVLWG